MARSTESKRAARQIRRTTVGRGRFNADELRRLGVSCNWRCHWCGIHCPTDYHVDHMVPLSKGGSNRIENVCISCPECNLRKGAKVNGESAPRRVLVVSDVDLGY